MSTNYTLDLNTGLTQVLSDGTNSYLYGNGRISQTGSVTEYLVSTGSTYHLGDALGSVRQLTDASGEITLAKNYDPYGNVTLSSGNGTSPFAYTGEQQDASGLTYLRARYYSSGDGRFLSRDTWGGDYNNPLSLNRWMYVEGNPVNLVDPSGMFPEWCKLWGDRLQYENCVRDHYHLEAPKHYQVMPEKQQEGSSTCWKGPVAYQTFGYLVGHAYAINFGGSYTFGYESVFDFGTMERAKFEFETAGLALDGSISKIGYHGIIYGFNNIQSIEEKYEGPYGFLGVGLSSANFLGGFSLGVGSTTVVSLDGELGSVSVFYSIGGGFNLLQVGSVAGGVGYSTWTGEKRAYASAAGVDFNRLKNDVYFNPDFPALNFIPSANVNGIALVLAAQSTWIFEEIHLRSRQ